MSLIILACGGLNDKIHRYHRSNTLSTDLDKMTYFTFTDCRFWINGKSIRAIPNRKDNIEGFYADSLTFVNVIKKSWEDSLSTSAKGKLSNFIYRYDNTKKSDARSFIASVTTNKPLNETITKAIISNNSDQIVGIYPSLSIKEVTDQNTYRDIGYLSEGGQEKYFDLIEKNPALSKELFMKVKVETRDIAAVADDPMTDVKVIVTTQNLCSEPADRIIKAKHRIYSRDLIFSEWSNAKLEWSTVDLGSIGVVRSGTFHAGTEFGSDTIAKGNASYDAKIESDAKFGFSKRYVSLSGSIAANEIVLYQEGAPGIDLSGTISFDARLKKAMGIRGNGVGEPLSNDDYAKEAVIFLFSEYTIRHVVNKKGARSYIEGDDDVEMLTIRTVKPYAYAFFNRKN